MQNYGAYLVDKQKYEVREAPMPVIEDQNDVLVRVEYVGICGADQDMFLTGRFGIFDVEYPKIIGHECAGVVIEVGSNVTSLKVGDSVAIEPGVPCGKCEACVKGQYNLCAAVLFKGAPPITGCNQQYIVHPAQWCFKLPKGVTTRDGSLMEPLAVGMHAANQGDVRMGDTIVISGAGPIGLCVLNVCRAKGATTIIVIDKSKVKLEKAQQMGAISVDFSSEDPTKRVEELTSGCGADVVFETSGSAASFLNTANYVKAGGTISCVGLGPKPVIDINYQALIYKEVTLKTVNRYRNEFPSCIAGLASGLLSTDGIITNEFNYEKIQEAYEYTVNNKDIVIKSIVKF